MAKKNKKPAAAPTGPRTVATNRKAKHEYFFEETYEAGIVLTGTEIKSVRAGRVSLQEGYIAIRKGEAMLMNVHIAHYAQGNQFNHEEVRPRKLLLHRKQIDQLESKTTQRGWTIIPWKVRINGSGLAKVDIALGRGKKNSDKRETIAKRDSDRSLRRAMKENY